MCDTADRLKALKRRVEQASGDDHDVDPVAMAYALQAVMIELIEALVDDHG